MATATVAESVHPWQDAQDAIDYYIKKGFFRQAQLFCVDYLKQHGQSGSGGDRISFWKACALAGQGL